MISSNDYCIAPSILTLTSEVLGIRAPSYDVTGRSQPIDTVTSESIMSFCLEIRDSSPFWTQVEMPKNQIADNFDGSEHRGEAFEKELTLEIVQPGRIS